MVSKSMDLLELQGKRSRAVLELSSIGEIIIFSFLLPGIYFPCFPSASLYFLAFSVYDEETKKQSANTHNTKYL